jgi:hypothetical protein
MNGMHRKVIALFAMMFMVAAILGAGAGLASAGPRPSFQAGFNLVGGPRGEISPEDFMSCLPSSSWNSLYVWDATNQTWQHYFNPAKGVPAYVNLPTVGAISRIPGLVGVAILMDEPVANPRVKESPADAC